MSNQYEPIDSPDQTTVFPYHDLTPPDRSDIFAARKRIEPYLPRTPLVRAEALSAELDADVYFKREDTLPIGAFKVRGGMNLVADLPQAFHDPGLIAASTGNHGQSIAYAGRSAEVPVTIVVPEDANPGKVTSMERLGATVRHHGETFDDARERAEELAAAEGYRYVHSANEPKLIAGIATAGLEILEERPAVDVVLNPVGGGSGTAAYCLSVGELADASVYGVQSEAAPAMYEAWAEGHLEPSDTMDTFAEGLATSVPFALTQDILREHLEDFLLVSDADLREAIADLLAQEHILAEGAAVAGIAGARVLGEALAGKTVVIPITGRNLSLENLQSILQERSAGSFSR
ncbi:MAG: threonine/serine dehydratase [Halodesulfurarchaeum sp.]